jgi:hypothetical protein
MTGDVEQLTGEDRAELRRKAGRHFELAAKAVGDALAFLRSDDPNARERATSRGERAVELIGMAGRMIRAADGQCSADSWGDY